MRCYLAKWRSAWVAFSHPEDGAHYLPLTLTINSERVAAALISNLKPTRETGIREIEDVPGGELQTLPWAGGLTRSVIWHPAQFHFDRDLEEPTRAASRLRQTVQDVVSCWSSVHRKVVHQLSGGLDSSIIAGCLGSAPTRPNVTCFNVFIAPSDQDMPLSFEGISRRYVEKISRVASHGDERKFAKLVTNQWGFALVEQERSASTFRLAETGSAPLSALPSRFVQYLDQDAGEIDLVRDRQATAVFNGLAGDEVLCATLQSYGAVDYVYHHGIGPRFLRELSQSCSLSREPVWLVLFEAVLHGLLRYPKRSPVDYLAAPNLLVADVARSVLPPHIAHPWDSSVTGLAPGKTQHVSGLSGSGLFYELEFHREMYADTIHVFSSQPVVELCLSIPVYTLLAGGVSRGLARRAFADLLPAEVRRRTTKGYTFSFANQVVRKNMDLIRDHLMGGQMVQEGLLDRDRLNAYLVPEQTFRSVSGTQILLYFGAEHWLRQWQSAAGQRAAA